MLGYDAWKLIQEGEQEDINLTERTQPLLLTSSVAIWRLWQQQGGPQPAAWQDTASVSGRRWSVPVWSSLPMRVEIVRARGAFMQQAVPVGVGAMAAIMGIEDQIVIDACAEAAEDQIAQR